MPLLKIFWMPFRRARLDQFMSVAITGFLVFLGSLVSHVGLSFAPAIDRLKAEVVATVFLNPSIDPLQEEQMFDQIKLSYSAPDREIQHVGADQFVSQIEKTYPDLAQQLLSLGGDMNSLVPRYVSITGPLSTDSIEQIKKLPGVERIETSAGRFAAMAGTLKALQWLIRMVALGLGVSIAVALWHLARIHRAQQAETFRLIQSLGASRLQIRSLSAASVALVGVLGSGLAVLLLNFLSVGVLSQISIFAPWLSQLSLKPTIEFSLFVVLVMTGLSASIGWISGRPYSR